MRNAHPEQTPLDEPFKCPVGSCDYGILGFRTQNICRDHVSIDHGMQLIIHCDLVCESVLTVFIEIDVVRDHRSSYKVIDLELDSL